MKINLISEDHHIILIDELLRQHTVNEGVMDIVDDAVEVVFGTAGLIPVVGDVIGDVPMIVKNILQKDWIGAAIFTISLVPEFGDIAKVLRIIQKVAKRTGQENRLNELMSYLFRKTPQGSLADYMMTLFRKAVENLYNILDKGANAKSQDDKVAKSIKIMSKIKEFIDDNVSKMEKDFEYFVNKMEDKYQELNANPVSGTDFPSQYIDDYTNRIKNVYSKLDHKDRITYLKKIKQNARKKPELMVAYNKVFWNSSE